MSTGTCVCKDGFFQKDGRACQACSSDCLTCQEFGTCDTCPQGATKAINRCLTCSKSEFIDGDQCSSCNSNCNTCNERANKCTSCKSNQVLKASKSCLTCDLGIDPTNSKACICADGEYLDQNFSCDVCDDTNCS